MDNELLWNNINALTKKQGLTQKTLALKCGFAERKIELLSSRRTTPKLDDAIKIANALETDVYKLCGTMYNNSMSEEESELLKMYSDLDDADKGVVMSTLKALHERYTPFSQKKKSGLSG